LKRIVLPLLLATIVCGCSETDIDLESDSLQVSSSDKRNPDLPYAQTASKEDVYAFASVEDLSKAGLEQFDTLVKPGTLLKPNALYIFLYISEKQFRSKSKVGVERDARALSILMPNGDEGFVAESSMRILRAECEIKVEQLAKNEGAFCNPSAPPRPLAEGTTCSTGTLQKYNECFAKTSKAKANAKAEAKAKERQRLSRKNQ
jgi:hypothetical protein